jgi:hypothetical protein
MLQVRRVEVNKVVSPPGRDVVEKFFREVAVRVEQRDPVASVYLLDEQISEQGRFTSSGLTDDVEVMAPVVRAQPEGALSTPNLAIANVGFIHVCKASFHSACEVQIWCL